jgi:hypothetical protein
MFAVIPSLYLESKLRTNSANASGQTPPKQTVVSINPRMSPQQLTANTLSPSVHKNLHIKSSEFNSGTYFFLFFQKIAFAEHIK